MSKLDKIRDTVACYLANFILRALATKQYRNCIDLTIHKGLDKIREELSNEQSHS